MKKVLSVLGLIGILSLAAPVNAVPIGGPGGPHGGHHGGQMVVAGPNYGHRPPRGGRQWGPPPPPHYNRGGAIVGGVLARRSYWGYPYCDYRLGWCDDFYYRPCPPPPLPAGFSTGVFIRF